ncbi:MAG: type IV toxin-antitoxin system AbiEi family antitoxin [Alphaproteobacteria bacterium]|nr:type IV toxin-antitoxin system AbiEi family antitoxin [Alphaproteobacteria bacterium]
MNYEIKHLSTYIDLLQARGKYVFEKTEALKALNCTDDAFRSSIKRLSQKQRITSLTQGLYLIIPLEYKNMSSLPPEWYIDTLMKHLGISYYVGLLTAASYHGASHQAPQIYQVIINKSLHSLQVGRSKIQFYKSALLEKAKINSFKVPTGTLRLATPEQTAFDLIRYLQASGGINHIATVLSELEESLNADKLVEIATQGMPLSCSQRLGYLLEVVGSKALAQPLKKWIKSKKLQYIPLKLSKQRLVLSKDENWKLIINDKVEPDI